MSWLARRTHQRFNGWIAGLGTDSGYRVVIGHWRTSPYGGGGPTRWSKTGQAAAPCMRRPSSWPGSSAPPIASTTSRSPLATPGARVRTGGCRPDHYSSRSPSDAASCWGWLLWVMPAGLARTTWWVSLLDLGARRLLPGVRTRGRSRDGRRQWYGAQDQHPIIAADATLDGRSLGMLRPVQPPVGFGFGSVPRRPSLVHLTTMIEAFHPPDGNDPCMNPAARQLSLGRAGWVRELGGHGHRSQRVRDAPSLGTWWLRQPSRLVPQGRRFTRFEWQSLTRPPPGTGHYGGGGHGVGKRASVGEQPGRHRRLHRPSRSGSRRGSGRAPFTLDSYYAHTERQESSGRQLM